MVENKNNETIEAVDIVETNDSLENIQEVGHVEDPLDKLVDLDFKDDVNIEEYSEVIHLLNRDSSILELEEADNIINTLGEKYVNKDYSAEINKVKSNIDNFFKKYDTENGDLKKLSNVERTNIYTVANFLIANYKNVLQKLTFKFDLTIKEYKFLSSALERKMHYNGADIFNVIDLNESYLKPWKKYVDTLPKDQESFPIDIDITSMVMIYHFLQKHSVKGISAEFYVFVSLLKKIADTNKIYNAYNVKEERLKQTFLQWNNNLDALDEI